MPTALAALLHFSLTALLFLLLSDHLGLTLLLFLLLPPESLLTELFLLLETAPLLFLLNTAVWRRHDRTCFSARTANCWNRRSSQLWRWGRPATDIGGVVWCRRLGSESGRLWPPLVHPCCWIGSLGG